MAATIARARMYAYEKEGNLAPTVINLPVKTGQATMVPGTGFIWEGTSGLLVKDNVWAASTTDVIAGLGEFAAAASGASGTLYPILLAIPGKFYVGSLIGTSATADFGTLAAANANGYTTVDQDNYACPTKAGAAAAMPLTAVCPISSMGQAVIRGNIIEKGGTTYGTGQSLVTNSGGVITDIDIRAIFIFNPDSTLFGR